MSFETAQVDRTKSSRNLKDLASFMSSEGGAAYRNETPLNTVETPHLRINLPKEPRASLETMQFDDTHAANRNGGVDRYEEGNGQIAHKSVSETTCIDHGVDALDIRSRNQTSVTKGFQVHRHASALAKTHIAIDGLLTVVADPTYLGRRH